MKKIGIIGAGIVGVTCAYYLKKEGYDVTLYDAGYPQGTKAAVGILCPWVSQRRNKKWYELANQGAHHYLSLIQEVEDSRFFKQQGTLITHNTNLDKLYNIALRNFETAPMMGEVRLLNKDELSQYTPQGIELDKAIYVSGGAQIDGALLVKTLLKEANLTVVNKRVTLNDTMIDGTKYDVVVCSCGPWLNEVLDAKFDVTKQKGQLIELKAQSEVKGYPVIMPQGEADILFTDDSIIVGATHMNDSQDDSYSKEEADYLRNCVKDIIADIDTYQEVSHRIGYRAVSKNHLPFFGPIDSKKRVYVASGLGSSGLTVGPWIAYLIAQSITGEDINFDDFNPLINSVNKR